MSIPEIHFLANSVEPVKGSLDLGCVTRFMRADSALSEIASLLKDNPTITLELLGHADADEDDVEALSLQRARRMACELMCTYGVEVGRLTAEGVGASRPRMEESWVKRMPKNEREQGRQANRRVEFRVTGFDRVPPYASAIGAIRFLSDPQQLPQGVVSFCDPPTEGTAASPTEETAKAAKGSDMVVVQTEVAEVAGPQSPSALIPVIQPNPIENDDLAIAGLPLSASALLIRVLTSDGRIIHEQRSAAAGFDGRLHIMLPSRLAPSTYLVKLNSVDQEWSLRFVKP